MVRCQPLSYNQSVRRQASGMLQVYMPSGACPWDVSGAERCCDSVQLPQRDPRTAFPVCCDVSCLVQPGTVCGSPDAQGHHICSEFTCMVTPSAWILPCVDQVSQDNDRCFCSLVSGIIRMTAKHACMHALDSLGVCDEQPWIRFFKKSHASACPSCYG